MKALVLGQKIWVNTWSRKRNSKLNYGEGVKVTIYWNLISIGMQEECKKLYKNNISSYGTYSFWAH